jgi:predicted dehydrogenase
MEEIIMLKIGAIGYGNRISGVIKILMSFDEDIKISAISDIDFENVRTRLENNNIDPLSVNLYESPIEMLDNEKLDGVFIGTRCSLHTKLAIEVLKRNIPLYLEKPVSTNMEDLLALKEAAAKSKCEVVVSFPLRLSPLVRLTKEIIDSGKLGAIEHVQAVNNVPYGGVYFHNWYRDELETGGLFLQKATHDLDYINYLLGIRPVAICAMKSKQIFKGDKPEGLYCKNCSEQNTCPEGPFYMKYVKFDNANGEMCCFARDTGNEDSGSAIVRYETGMHVNYSQNFFARKKAASRGARFLGYNGTVEFDWFTDEVKVFMHNTERIESYKLDTSKMSHSGGDDALALNFINIMKGTEKSLSNIESGLLSALMCIKANKSATTDTFQKIDWQ